MYLYCQDTLHLGDSGIGLQLLKKAQAKGIMKEVLLSFIFAKLE